jgi:ATP-dependent DNA helicase RecG
MNCSEIKTTVSLNKESVTSLSGVGPKMAARLEKCGVVTVQDVLFHLPMRYEDRTVLTPLGHARPGQAVLVEGEIVQSEVVMAGRRSLLCHIRDGNRFLLLRWYHFNMMQQRQLKPGLWVRCFGEVRFGSKGLEISHPDYKIMTADNRPALTGELTPVYPSTEGVTQFLWRKLSDQALKALAQSPCAELLPDVLCDEYQLPSLSEALKALHRPTRAIQLNSPQFKRYRSRLAFEELLAHQLSLRRLRHAARVYQAPLIELDQAAESAFLNALPFALTGAQARVLKTLYDDLKSASPMLRLVQGDVGSGKTVVAAMAALQAVAKGFQVAIMAPTEILAEQHFQHFTRWFAPLGYQLAWLSSQVKGKKRVETLANIASGKAAIVVGTHALFQKEVTFAKLALIVIDEQHRFGVHQRMQLRDKGAKDNVHPHQLIMTATPIPRTLAMCAYADLDQSIIDELPPGRKPIKTVVMDNHKRASVVERIDSACQTGRQAYWVCTLIEESELLQCQAAEVTAKQLQRALPRLSVGLVHGRMKASEKEAVMQAFKRGEIHLLVATTVIEVGVDVPNASLMIIDNPERLGLSQLHQLRGRVGRGDQDSHCVLMYQHPLSKIARERLTILRESQDGFVIAEKDLQLRGPGEVLGTKQTGDITMRIADLIEDSDWLPIVQEVADDLLVKESDRVNAIIDRWLGRQSAYGLV